MATSRHKVMVLNPSMGVYHMFNKHKDYEALNILHDKDIEPDLVCFTGGSDVNPEFYGEEKLLGTYCNTDRDELERKIFDKYKDTPKVGICRGGQFLNVMNGGKMWQDISNHTSDHILINLLKTDEIIEEEIKVTSTHHQMMIPNSDLGIEIAIALHSEDKKKGLSDRYVSASRDRTIPKWDTEVVWYPGTNSLCFQPHPEYEKYPKMTKYFFDLLEHFYF